MGIPYVMVPALLCSGERQAICWVSVPTHAVQQHLVTLSLFEGSALIDGLTDAHPLHVVYPEVARRSKPPFFIGPYFLRPGRVGEGECV